MKQAERNTSQVDPFVYARHVEDPEFIGGVNLSALSSRPKGLRGVSPLCMNPANMSEY